MFMLCVHCVFFFFKQKTAYEMRISDWSSDVCSSDLRASRSLCRWLVVIEQAIRLRKNILLHHPLPAVWRSYHPIARAGLQHALTTAQQHAFFLDGLPCVHHQGSLAIPAGTFSRSCRLVGSIKARPADGPESGRAH